MKYFHITDPELMEFYTFKDLCRGLWFYIYFSINL